MAITQEYIDDHLGGVHTWESWGRSIFEQALNEARRKVKGKSAESVELKATIRVSPVFAPSQPGAKKIPFCIHVDVDVGSSNTGISWHNKAWHESKDKA